MRKVDDLVHPSIFPIKSLIRCDHDFFKCSSGSVQTSAAGHLTCHCDLAHISTSTEKLAQTIDLMFLVFCACVCLAQCQIRREGWNVGTGVLGNAARALCCNLTTFPSRIPDSTQSITHVEQRLHALRQHGMLCKLCKSKALSWCETNGISVPK
jgi:hypothetical protein